MNTIERNSLPEKMEKRLHIEVLRILACFFVIFNHTESEGFFLFSRYHESSPQFWIYGILSVFCKFSVPAFFAISGALLLDKEENLKDIFCKRILRIAMVLLLVSLPYYFLKQKPSTASLYDFCNRIYGSQLSTHLWYLYTFIALLLSLPLLRVFARNLKEEHILYMLICSVFFSGVLPVAQYFLWKGDLVLNSKLRADWITSNIVLYPCIGYYMEHKMDTDRIKKWIPWLWCLNFAAILTTCAVICYQKKVTGICNETSSQGFHSAFAVINTVTIYCTAKCYVNSKKMKDWLKSVIYSLGSCTFGIYLFHMLFIHLFIRFYVLPLIRDHLVSNPMISCLLYCFLIMAFSYGITLVLKKVPGLKKLL